MTSGPTRRELAPAKVNLTLHVTGRRNDGYHLLDSLVVFPAIGDVLEAEPATGLSLTLDGPFGADLHAGSENLVLRAAELMRPAGRGPGAALRLVKCLPVASGIGGGSSDAAATLRLLSRLWERPLPDSSSVLSLGADVPVCLAGESSRMRGIGERLVGVTLPPFWVVLVNPRVPVPTKAVFAALSVRQNSPMPEPARFGDLPDMVGFLASQRNDLEAPALTVQPRIGAVLEALTGQPGCALARMSGSGATCFGVFARQTAALDAVAALGLAHPDWWVAAGPVGQDSPQTMRATTKSARSASVS